MKSTPSQLSIEERKHLQAMKKRVWEKTNGICYYCGLHMNPFDGFSVDHFLPQSNGGSHDLENLVPACRSCNSMKGPRTIEEFRKTASRTSILNPMVVNLLIAMGYADIKERLQEKVSNLKFWFETQS